MTAKTIVVIIMTNKTAHVLRIILSVKMVVAFQFIGVAMVSRIASLALMKLVAVSEL